MLSCINKLIDLSNFYFSGGVGRSINQAIYGLLSWYLVVGLSCCCGPHLQTFFLLSLLINHCVCIFVNPTISLLHLSAVPIFSITFYHVCFRLFLIDIYNVCGVRCIIDRGSAQLLPVSPGVGVSGWVFHFFLNFAGF